MSVFMLIYSDQIYFVFGILNCIVLICSLLIICSYVTHYNIITCIIFSYRTCFVLHIPLIAAHNLQEMIYISSELVFKS